MFVCMNFIFILLVVEYNFHKRKHSTADDILDQINESSSIISTDFETAITKAGCGKFNILMMLIAVPASCTSAFVIGTMSYVVPVAGADLGLTPVSKALLQSAPFAGMIASAFFWGVLSDSLGRQKLLAIGFLLDFTMNTLCALIPTLPTILFFKFLSGIMVCGPYSIFMAYISEVFLDKRRNIAVLSAGLFSHTGSIIHSCLAMFLIPSEMPDWLPLKSWQVFILCCGLPALLAGLGCCFTVESPKFLAEKGKSEEALDVCKTIYTINTGKSPDLYPVEKIHQTQVPKKTSAKEKIMAAFTVLRRPYIFRLLLVFGMQLCISVSKNSIRLWLPDMLTVISSATSISTNETLVCPLLTLGKEVQTSGAKVISKTEVYTSMMIVNASCLLFHIIFMFLTKFMAKRYIMMCISVIAASCGALLPNVHADLVFIPASVMIATLNTGFYAAIGIVVEIFPTSVRATSVSLQMMIGRVGILIANFLFANLIYSYCEIVFYNLSFLAACLLVISVFLSTTPISAVPEARCVNGK